MVDKPKDKASKQKLSDEAGERIKAEIIHGDVGYGRPPKEHQFQKGQRANPSGRPRKLAPDLTLAEQPYLSAVHAVLKKSVRARDGDKVVEVSTHEALAQAALNFALKGNARYYGILVDSARQAERHTLSRFEKRPSFGAHIKLPPANR